VVRNPNADLAHYFDVIGGNSIGGVIIAMLAILNWSSTNWLGPGIGFIGSASTTILHNDWKLSRGVYIFVLIGLVLLLGVISSLIVVVKPWTISAIQFCVEFNVSLTGPFPRSNFFG